MSPFVVFGLLVATFALAGSYVCAFQTPRSFDAPRKFVGLLTLFSAYVAVWLPVGPFVVLELEEGAAHFLTDDLVPALILAIVPGLCAAAVVGLWLWRGSGSRTTQSEGGAT